MTNQQSFLGHIAPDIDPSWLSLPVGLAGMGAILVYAPLPTDTATMLAITVLCICLWVGAPVAPWFTGLVCLGLIGVAFSTDLALVGFHSPATWLIVFGILLGEAARKSGLATLVEEYVLHVVPDAVADDATVVYPYMLVALSAAAAAMVVLVPSALVRVLILGPILVSMGEVFTDRRPRVGLFLGPLFVTYYAGTGILTGSLGNIIITGLVESNAGVSIGWVEWFVLLAPVMWVGRTVAIVVIAYVLYRPRGSVAIAATDIDGTPDMSTDERRMLSFLLIGVVFWATDSIHGLHPLYGALVVTLLAYAPRIGVVDPDAVSDADFSIIFFLGAIFAVADGLKQTGFTDLAAKAILSSLPTGAPLVVVLGFVVATAITLSFLMEGLAVASVLTPVLVSFTAKGGIPLLPVAMTEAIALNTYFFPYQSAVLIGILGLGVVDARELVRMAVICSLVTLLVLLPIQLLVFATSF